MDFEASKAIAAVAFLHSRTSASLYPVLKMLYLADKRHLERHGRFIVGDRYFALAQGPVPTATYDMLKYLRGDRKYFAGDVDPRAFLTLSRDDHSFALVREPDYGALSESDVECLQEIAELCRLHGTAHIRALSHDSAWRAAGPNRMISDDAIASQLASAPELIQHLADRFPGEAS